MGKLNNYKGSIGIMGGFKSATQAPLMQACDIVVDENDTRLDEKLLNIVSSDGSWGESMESVNLEYEIVTLADNRRVRYVKGFGTCMDRIVKIPAFVGGLRVTGIMANAFADLENIEKIIIDEKITVIEENAFSGLNCEIVFESLASGVLQTGAFNGFEGFVSFGKNVTEIPSKMFYKQPIKQVIFHDGIKHFRSYCFYGTSLSYSLSFKCPTIEKGAFQNTYLESIAIDCNPRENNLKESVQLWDYAFAPPTAYPAQLKGVLFKGSKLPYTITAYSFYGSKDVTFNVHWNEGEVKNAPWGATNATINYNFDPSEDEKKTEELSQSANLTGSYRPALTLAVEAKYTELEDGTYELTRWLSNATVVDLCIGRGVGRPHTITSIGWGAFIGTNVAALRLPSTVNRIVSGAFERCPTLKTLLVDEANPVYESAGNCIYTKQTEDAILVAGCAGSILGELHNSTVVIGSSAFNDNRGLKHIKATGNEPSELGDSAFCSCEDLKSVYLEPTDIQIIPGRAFARCCDLTDVRLPYNVKYIESYAFEDCFSLKSIVIPASCERIGQNAFKNCTNLTDIYVERTENLIGYQEAPWGAPNVTVHYQHKEE